MDNMKDRLKKLLGQIFFDYSEECVACTEDGYKPIPIFEDFFADPLIANGVILPPCNIGQTVYTRYGYSFKIQRIEVLEDKKILFRCGNDGTDDYMAFYDFEIGTEVFLTKEEAEQELDKRGKENE